MTAAISGHHPGAVVDAVSVANRDDGTNRRARLALRYAAGDGPATVFVKAIDPEHADLVELTSGLYHEPRLFLAQVALPLDHPRVYHAVIDEERRDFLLLMEDVVARGADPRDATRPLSIDEAARGVRGLARLHGAFWGERITDNPALSWVEPFVPFAGLELAPLDIAYQRLGNSVSADITALSGAELFGGIWARYIRGLTRGSQTLLHGDPHIGNTYLLPDGDVGFLDWQMVRRGNFSLDLGYFLQGALSTDDRRAGERALLEEYRDALGLPAAELPSAEEIWLHYRASAAHGLAIWIATLSGGDNWQRTDISLAFAQRYGAAFTDLDTREALDALTRRRGVRIRRRRAGRS